MLLIYELATKLQNYECVEQKLILPDLSYQIIGALFEVFNELGAGLKEKHYYSAVQHALENRKLSVKMQVRMPVKYVRNILGEQFLDFLINDMIVLELKVSRRFRKPDYEQIKAYLVTSGCPLGILARFDEHGVTHHRVLNPNNL